MIDIKLIRENKELVKENTSQPLNNVVDKAELSIELEDLCYNGDASYQNYKKINEAEYIHNYGNSDSNLAKNNIRSNSNTNSNTDKYNIKPIIIQN